MSELNDAKVKVEEERADMYDNFGIAAVVLALCLGLGSCGLMSSIADKYDAEAKLIRSQVKP